MNTLKFIFLAATASFAGLYANAQSEKIRDVHLGFVYPLSTNGRSASEYSNRLSLHVLAGLSRAETGLSLAGIALDIKDSASGLQCSGFLNRIGNRANGLQMAGFMNITGSSNGVSMAGFANLNRDSSSGAQVAGFINKSGNAGSQVAGFINIAKKVKGVQVAGFINIADSSDYPIALLNFIKNGERSISLSIDETLTTLLSFRSGGRKLYGILSIGYNNKDHDSLFAWQAGLGIHIPVTRSFRVDVEGLTTGLTDFKRDDYYRSTLRVLPSLRFAHRIVLFAGPSFNYIRSDRGMGAGLVTNYLWKEKESSGQLHGLYIGVTGGVSIIL